MRRRLSAGVAGLGGGPDMVMIDVVRTIAAERGARTMALDPAALNLSVVAQKYEAIGPNAAPATRPGGRGRGRGCPPAVPDSLHVLSPGMSR